MDKAIGAACPVTQTGSGAIDNRVGSDFSLAVLGKLRHLN
jgi:hypothetical protein